MSGPTPSGDQVPFVPGTAAPAASAAFWFTAARIAAAESAPACVAWTPANCASFIASVIGVRQERSAHAGAAPLGACDADTGDPLGAPTRVRATVADAAAANAARRPWSFDMTGSLP